MVADFFFCPELETLTYPILPLVLSFSNRLSPEFPSNFVFFSQSAIRSSKPASVAPSKPNCISWPWRAWVILQVAVVDPFVFLHASVKSQSKISPTHEKLTSIAKLPPCS